MRMTINRISQTGWPLYWFAKLEQALQTGDRQRADEARDELAKLGVDVQYGDGMSPASDQPLIVPAAAV